MLYIAVPESFPLYYDHGSQMHVPGPSQEMCLAYSTVAWEASELPLYTSYRCMYPLNGVLRCQRGQVAIEWEVAFRVLEKGTNALTVHSSLQAYLLDSKRQLVPQGSPSVSTAVGTILSY